MNLWTPGKVLKQSSIVKSSENASVDYSLPIKSIGKKGGV
jgi:hypothetical protein